MSPSYLESYEDNIKIDKDLCIFCGRCADRCILDNIRLKLAPCRQACPMGVNVQGYVQLIKRGEFDQARELVREQLPFPEIVCLVCHHPCEAQCTKGEAGGEPVSIRRLKRFLFDGAALQDPPARAAASGRRIAVLGAGPAGLVAAHDLALKGHAVTVYDAEHKPGGMLRGGIPAFRLPEAVVDKELAVLPALGVDFVLNTRVGRDIALAEIMAAHDAVVAATGMWSARNLGVEGEELANVHSGLSFLRASRSGKGPELSGAVVVVGGGNMAVDAAMTALRQGAESVTLLSLEAQGELPAFEAELLQAAREGVRFKHSCGIERIEGKNGKVSGLVLSRCLAVFDEQGNFAPKFSEEREHLRADAVITAIGLASEAGIFDGSGISLRDARQADPLTLQCGQSKVFAAGDLKGGAGSVIKSMAMGREAAVSADRYVRGEHLRFERGYPGPVLTDFALDKGADDLAPAQQPAERPYGGKGDYALLEQAYTEEQARAEAARCLSCGGPCGKHRTCWFCLPCEVECPQKALWVDIPYLLR